MSRVESRPPFTRERERRPCGSHGKAVMTRSLVRVVLDQVRATGLLRPLVTVRKHLPRDDTTQRANKRRRKGRQQFSFRKVDAVGQTFGSASTASRSWLEALR